jgi:hypothetical protein
MFGYNGAIVSNCNTGPEVTVRLAKPITAPEVAVMFVVPAATAFTIPWLPLVLLTVADDGEEESQDTDVLMSCWKPLLYEPMAVYCCVLPVDMEFGFGVTLIEVNVAGVSNRYGSSNHPVVVMVGFVRLA